jgi:hypothetical protein
MLAGGGWTSLPTEKMRSPDPEATPIVPLGIVEPTSESVPLPATATSDSAPVAVELEAPAEPAAPALATVPAAPFSPIAATAPYPSLPPAAPFPPPMPAAPFPPFGSIAPAARAVPHATPSHAYLATEVIRPIHRGTASRRRPLWIAAALVGAGLGAMMLVALRGDESPARPARVSVTAQVHAPAEPPPPPPPTTGPAAAVTVEPIPAAAAAPAIEPAPEVQPPPAIAEPATVRPRPAATRPRAAPAVATPAAQTPTETPRVAPESGLVAELYGEIGRALKRLDETHGQEATYDLWPRFRHIHILEALRTPAARGAAHDALRYLEGEIARRAQ